MIPFVETDGGRREAGFTNTKIAGDCVTRAVTIASGRPYIEVYAELAEINQRMSITRRRKAKGVAGRLTASRGIYTKSKLFKDYMILNGFEWIPTMQIGSGCMVHVRASELPKKGRFVLRLSKHCTALVDGILMDAYDCSRDGTRAVYGYWRLK
jgi:hypothetical protein